MSAPFFANMKKLSTPPHEQPHSEFVRRLAVAFFRCFTEVESNANIPIPPTQAFKPNNPDVMLLACDVQLVVE